MDRVVLDNTSLAVKDILARRDRVQTEAVEAFRGTYPFQAEFCVPAKGWEKGSDALDSNRRYDRMCNGDRTVVHECRTIRWGGAPLGFG